MPWLSIDRHLGNQHYSKRIKWKLPANISKNFSIRWELCLRTRSSVLDSTSSSEKNQKIPKLPRSHLKGLLLLFMFMIGLFLTLLEKGQPVTNGFRFPTIYQRLRLSHRRIVGKCLLPTARLSVLHVNFPDSLLFI